MAERDHMVIALVKDVLGPRDGPFERLPADLDPHNEYILGVLTPRLEQRVEDDPDADTDIAIEELTDDESQGLGEGVIIAPPSAFSPALDPKAQPRSIGLTFVVTASHDPPSIDICATWARYTPTAEGDWQRIPDKFVLARIDATTDHQWTTGGDVDLYMHVRPQPDGSYRVSLYLVNQRRVIQDTPRKPDTAHYVFQPQIRVHCAAGTGLASVVVTPPDAGTDLFASEDAELAMLYRKRTSLARGHLCGATWKEIDPERPHPDLEAPDAAPFVWIDRPLLPADEQSLFAPADVRTELLPCYPIEAPETAWPDPAGIQPLLDPLALAQIWQPAEIHRALDPLVRGYEQWIAAQRQEIVDLISAWQPLATTNLDQCERTARRMQEGIEWLVRDEDVRLAFCFANQAMALQSQWAYGSARPWRPFQLAFILLNIPALADPAHDDRNICDLLWFPTGGGKTEAYLGLAALTLALRRRRALQQNSGDRTGGGVSVLSRYTLRLLTIQQFRRALGVITACEWLRVAHLADTRRPTGWRPEQCPATTTFLWGGLRFSAGMWVGGGVTPNRLLGIDFPLPSQQFQHIAGAIEILQGVSSRYQYYGPDQALRRRLQGKRVTAEGDPAQVLTCPVCQALLALPEEGLDAGQYTLHFMFTGHARTAAPFPSILSTPRIPVDDARLAHHSAPGTHTLSVTFTIPEGSHLFLREIDHWWYQTISPHLSTTAQDAPRLLAARPTRPGYVLCSYENSQSAEKYNTFEIYCPNPRCPLNQQAWAEQVPVSVVAVGVSSGPSLMDSLGGLLPSTPGLTWQQIAEPFRRGGQNRIAERIPIPACTADDQVYHRCPSLVIATVDKFAQLAFEPKASTMFGHVTHYHSRWGYYREGCPPDSGTPPRATPMRDPPGYDARHPLHVPVAPFQPPDLIIQDELHLLEGPLGSLVGLYETAIDALCEYRLGQRRIHPKYVASTATVRQAESQVQAIFDRHLAQFPPSALEVDDRFFARTRESHPLEASRAGRLYIGVAAPGKGAQTPIVRIWSALLQAAHERYLAGSRDELDCFWTLVGYFNALRELAGAAALYRQDIRERLGPLPDSRVTSLSDQPMELSSRRDSLTLPGLLERLAQPWSEDAVLATSMFGTGVDVNRLGLMVVHGQPKTSSAYIQATGRVGRQQGGLVVTFFRVSRPRDLDHYEFFTGYHRMLYRAVEPVTVTPYAPRARERGCGPLAVALLRQATQIDGHPVREDWRMQQRIQGGYFSQAILMDTHRRDREVQALPAVFEGRAQSQPDGRRPAPGVAAEEVASELDRWESIAHDYAHLGEATNQLVYNESTMNREPERGVILGDAQHQLRFFPVAFENAPTSLRDVEETTQFEE